MTERGALGLSAGAALALGIVGTTAALLTGSGAILLDGLFNLCFFATALLALRVSTLVARPDDARYPFGYMFFEPLINTGKGLLILGVSLFALVDAVAAVIAGGRAVAFGPAILYAVAATVACTVVALILRRESRARPSPLVAADVENWTVNAIVSGGVLTGFVLATLLERGGHAGAAALVDPAMVALVVLLSIAIPVRMALGGLLALLNRAPDAAIVADMEARVRAALAGLPVNRLFVRATRPGRTAYIVIHAVLPEGAGLDLAEADRRRGAIIASLAARHGPMVADVIFTGVEAYAAPAAGDRGMS
jgi:predicted Co/Zn/Cd cation transporter (cation efflux family)